MCLDIPSPSRCLRPLCTCSSATCLLQLIHPMEGRPHLYRCRLLAFTPIPKFIGSLLAGRVTGMWTTCPKCYATESGILEWSWAVARNLFAYGVFSPLSSLPFHFRHFPSSQRGPSNLAMGLASAVSQRHSICFVFRLYVRPSVRARAWS